MKASPADAQTYHTNVKNRSTEAACRIGRNVVGGDDAPYQLLKNPNLVLNLQTRDDMIPYDNGSLKQLQETMEDVLEPFMADRDLERVGVRRLVLAGHELQLPPEAAAPRPARHAREGLVDELAVAVRPALDGALDGRAFLGVSGGNAPTFELATFGVSPASTILSMIFCFDCACLTRLE